MNLIVDKAKSTSERLTKHAIAFYTSGQLFLEEYYALALVGKAGLNTLHMSVARWRSFDALLILAGMGILAYVQLQPLHRCGSRLGQMGSPGHTRTSTILIAYFWSDTIWLRLKQCSGQGFLID